ncbi:polymeric immunoglobulin receptor-like [Onychostoma macrolepis]|nr:polymeric immunoglobulin receptor-like [Onychostoma macrolepis]
MGQAQRATQSRRRDEQLSDQTSSIAVPLSEGGGAILRRVGSTTAKGLRPCSECPGHGLPETGKIKPQRVLSAPREPACPDSLTGITENEVIHRPKCTTGSTSRVLTVQTGGSLIIPCYYDSKYTEHKKYWCFDAKSAFNYCSILAYANETKEKVSVLDHPDQSFFTVTMRNLKYEDTGAYWCAVEIGGIFEPDEKEHLHLTVQSVPDVSVVSSSVSGREGGDLSVQCFYSSGCQNVVKRWCRYKDQSCYPVRSSSVQISDDGRRSFTVLMTGLRLTDSGWYFCSAGDQQAFVQLDVTENPQVSVFTVTESKPAAVATEGFGRNNRDANTISSTTPVSVNTNQTDSSEEQQNKLYLHLEAWIPAVVLLMVIAVSVILLRKKCYRNDTHVSN